MDRLLFGISGIPIGDGTQKFTYKSGITYLKALGLDAMELPFVRSVNVTDKNKNEILKEKENNDFYLSAHGSYFINLNADEIEKQEQSLERILKGANALKLVGGKSLVFHAGYYLDDSKEETYDTIKANLLRLPDIGIQYRLETTGKATQFGSIEELVALCREIPTCGLCIDFSHIHARGNGMLKNYDDFAVVLKLVEDVLGRKGLDDLHIHMSGINYGPKGEKNHLPFEESDFNYKACLKALKDFNAKGCIICESPILERDALLLKETYSCL
jgi:deoxyribonuclease-4